MPQVLWFLVTTIVITHLVPLPVLAARADNMAPSPLLAPRPDCPPKCGDVDIPYPFGIGKDCSFPGFNLTCNHSLNPPRPYWFDVEVVGVTLEAGEMRIRSLLSYVCFNSSNTIKSSGGQDPFLDHHDSSPFLISAARNEFTAIGCSTLAILDSSTRIHYTGCITSCTSVAEVARDGDKCTGLGCCQTSIPGDLNGIRVTLMGDGKATDDNPSWEFSPCSYAFVAEKGWYHFKQRDLKPDGNQSFASRVGYKSIPTVLEWAIRSRESCPVSPEASACVSANSLCVSAMQGPGYLCKCSDGYEGNPYVIDGCTNINECELRKLKPAWYEKQYPCGSGSKCHDTNGSYTCECKFGHRGNGKTVQGCRPIVPGYAIGIVAIFVCIVLACFAIMLLQRRRRRLHYNNNGGDILKDLGINIFTVEELKKITKRYSQPIGEGFFGTVYMGTIDGAQPQQVAVKCSVDRKEARRRQKMLRHEAPQQEQEALWKDGFVKEISFQFRIKHMNVVRLVGCCLETYIPRLVFEFIPNGSLDAFLHRAVKPCALPLPKRLDIAVGSAEALSYMHSQDEYGHIHGDLKPANILLDGDLKPKVSDFGSSKLLSVDKYVKDVAADSTYADPVYFQTARFTTKSDVYSFGVVLLELVTRKMARYGDKILTIDFKNSYKGEDKGRNMYDPEILSDGNAQSHHYMECLDMVGALAVQCLNGDADERPTMAQVVQELKRVKSIACEGPCSETTEEAPAVQVDEASKYLGSA
ncbi:unnamed protein product [Urochloa humidicola]